MFKILSIDGGGIKGIFATKILALIEAKLNIKIHDTFDLIVGTSTGSIVAGTVAIDSDLAQLVDDYSEKAPEIFQKQWNLCGLFRSKYNNHHLEIFLHQKFKEKKLGEIKKPLILNATNVSMGDVHVFKSAYQQKQRGNAGYVRDGEIPLFKAVLASCATPTYFDPVNINGTLICDGGIWANNPALVGYTDAINNFKAKTNNVKILSIGTGKSEQCYQKSKNWGLLYGWEKTKFVDFVMSCQTKFPENVLNLIFKDNKDNILRINPNIEYCSLDNYREIANFKEKAKQEFTNQSAKIKNFLKEV